MNAQWIDLTARDGGHFQGYLALPPTGSGPGIVLIQEIFGVNPHIRAVADQYAMDGYTVLAPDLFWRAQPRFESGYAGAELQRSMALMQALDFQLALADLVSSCDTLRARSECRGRLSTIGYCMGGLLAYRLAALQAVDAAVSYYPGRIQSQLDQAAAVRCPIQFHFGDRDAHLPATAVDAVASAFAGHPHAQVHRYPDADHGFNCWARASYHQPSAVRAHGRTLEFLADHG